MESIAGFRKAGSKREDASGEVGDFKFLKELQLQIVKSVNNVPKRITEERLNHIFNNHDDLAGFLDQIIDALEFPDYIIQGYIFAKIALRIIRVNKYLAVVYKETSENDGFLITEYFTSKLNLGNGEILWKA